MLKVIVLVCTMVSTPCTKTTAIDTYVAGYAKSMAECTSRGEVLVEATSLMGISGRTRILCERTKR